MTASNAPAGAPRNPRNRAAHAPQVRDFLRARRRRGIARVLVLSTGLAAGLAAAFAVGAASVVAAAPAADGAHARAESSRARALAAGCTTCHQPGVAGLPALSGQSREALRTRLEGYRDGSLPGTVMPQLVRGYTPAELDLVAQWFAAERAPR